jgi:beta-1,4-N-acetylglucosaminyltransferase
MIFVTVGTHSQGFDRLIQKIDEIAAGLDEPVIMQTGASMYQPRHTEYFKYRPSQEIDDLVKEARVVVSHAGAASIINVLKYRKPLIIIPRQKKYNEHIDDHQMELASVMAEKRYIQAVYQVEDLPKALENTTNIMSDEITTDGNKECLVSALRRYLKVIENTKR